MKEFLAALVILAVVHGVGFYWTLAHKRMNKIQLEEE